MARNLLKKFLLFEVNVEIVLQKFFHVTHKIFILWIFENVFSIWGFSIKCKHDTVSRTLYCITCCVTISIISIRLPLRF